MDNLINVNFKQFQEQEVCEDMTEEELGKAYKEWNIEWSKQLAEQEQEDKLKHNKAKRVYICRHDYHTDEEGQPCCVCEVVIDENIARELDKDYKLATIDEVMMCVEDLECEDGYVKVIEVEEGIYGWAELEYFTELDDQGELFCNYIFLEPNTEWQMNDLKRIIGNN